jgi:hypothetical protein
MNGFLKLLMLNVLFVSQSCKQEFNEGFENKVASSKSEIGIMSVANLTIETGMTLAQMNSVIAAANAGDTVWVEAGTYYIPSGKIVMKSGVTLQRKTAVNPIFDATSVANGMLTMPYYTGQIDNCLIRGITFHNIRFSINSAQNLRFMYCDFDYGKRPSGTDKNFYQDAYIQLTGTDSAVVDNCNFYRRSGNSGRAIWNTSATNSKIINNDIGDGGALGYFVTGINESATNNTIIQANKIKRNPALNTDDAQTDHGIYAHSFDQVLIKYNTISGWPANASGGSVKARNGQNISIFGNNMTGSGVLLYEYSGSTSPFLKYVDVSYNTIDITTNVNDIYHGIGYWRNNATDMEYSIRITHNTMPNGTINFIGANLDVSNFNASSGGVFDNDMGILNIKTGINNSGNF